MPASRFIAAVRRADWLTPERGRAYSLMGVIAFTVMAAWVWWQFTSKAQVGLGGDFLSFYAASKLALSGHAADAWRPAVHAAAEAQAMPGKEGYMAFFYPPAYLLLCWPLALVPYGWALLAWVTGTAAAAVSALRLLFGKTIPFVVLLAFPAVWINLGCGQNGALTLAILAAGFGLLDRRPIVAGLVLGLMVIKPQFAIALPFVLGASGRWKAFFATGFSALGLCGLAYLAVGPEGYAAFFHNSAYARAALDRGVVDPALMQSLYASLRVLDVPVMVAYAAQILLSAATLAVASFTAFRRRPDGVALGALTVMATVLATPFSLDYDLLIIALPLGWLVMSGAQKGFRDWEKLALLAAFFLPLLSRKLAQLAELPVAPLVLAVVFAFVVRRTAASEPVPAKTSAPAYA